MFTVYSVMTTSLGATSEKTPRLMISRMRDYCLLTSPMAELFWASPVKVPPSFSWYLQNWIINSRAGGITVATGKEKKSMEFKFKGWAVPLKTTSNKWAALQMIHESRSSLRTVLCRSRLTDGAWRSQTDSRNRFYFSVCDKTECVCVCGALTWQRN